MKNPGRASIPGGVNSGQRLVTGLEDLVIAKTSGATFTDDTGRTYTDYHAAFGPPILGHNDPDVDRAVAETTRSVDLPGVAITMPEIVLAEKLVELVPSVEKALLTVTGSEATFHALRVSRTATGRRLIVKFQGCYHGWHDSVSLNVISAPDKIGAKDPLSQGILPEIIDATLVLPFNDLSAVREAFQQYGDDIAAVILEPIPHNIGCVMPDQEFLEGLRELCTTRGSVLIFDEVITGFRHSLGGYQKICGVMPDITTLGKAIANGYPISAIGGKRELMELFNTTPGRPAFFAGTFNGHPAMVAAALATIEKLSTEPVHQHLFELGEQARTGLREVFAGMDVDAVVSGFGSVFVSYFMPGEQPKNYEDLLANDADLFVGYRRALMSHGVFELPLNLKRSHISYAHTAEDIHHLLGATEKAVHQHLQSVGRGR